MFLQVTCTDSVPRVILRYGPRRVTAGITTANPTVRVYHFYSPGTLLWSYRSYDRTRIENAEGGERGLDNVASNLYPVSLFAK